MGGLPKAEEPPKAGAPLNVGGEPNAGAFVDAVPAKTGLPPKPPKKKIFFTKKKKKKIIENFRVKNSPSGFWNEFGDPNPA